MHQSSKTSPIYSAIIVLVGSFLLLFSLISVGMASYPAVLGVLLMAFGAFGIIRIKLSASKVKNSG